MNFNHFFRRDSSQSTNLKEWPTRKAVLHLLFACFVSALYGQQLAPIAEPEYEFVSGTIAELPPSRIVVNRAVLGKPAENRVFLITSETKIEGALKAGARVTVGFKPSDEGDVAMRIIVRSTRPEQKNR